MEITDIWNELGNTYYKAGLLDKAAAAYQKSVHQETQSGWCYSNLATIFVLQGKFLEAISLFQKSLEYLPEAKDQSLVWGRLGNLYQRINEHGKAIQAYQKADDLKPRKNLSPKDIFIQFDKEELGENTNDAAVFDRAIMEDDCKDATSELGLTNIQPGGEARVLNELGLVLFKVGQYEEAIDAYQEAIQIDPKLPYLYSNLGQVYTVQGKLNEASDLFAKSIALFTNSKDKAVSWSRLGDIYRQMGEVDSALAANQLAEALSQTTPLSVNEYRLLSIELIIVPPGMERDPGDIEDLTASIRVHGIIQPLIVCRDENEKTRYFIIAGRRRLAAAYKVGLKEVPVIIRRATNREIIELSINENIHHVGMDPFDLAKRYQQLANEYDLSIEEISARMGRSSHSIANTMKVLEQPVSAIPARPTAQSSSAAGGDYRDIEGEVISGVSAGTMDATPTLWYLEPTAGISEAQMDDSYYPDTNSLLNRARNVLKSNPHPKRVWAVSSPRA